MPIQELKNYVCVCDECGKKDATWTLIREEELLKVVPRDWSVTRETGDSIYMAFCEDCTDTMGLAQIGEV